MAVRSVVGTTVPNYNLAVWHGFTYELLMSIVAMSGGVWAYFVLRSYLLASAGPPFLRHIDGQRFFQQFLAALTRLAVLLLRIVDSQRLQSQLRSLLLIDADRRLYTAIYTWVRSSQLA